MRDSIRGEVRAATGNVARAIAAGYSAKDRVYSACMSAASDRVCAAVSRVAYDDLTGRLGCHGVRPANAAVAAIRDALGPSDGR